MKNFFRFLFGLFSFYANPFEAKVARFFRGVKSTSNVFEVRKKLLKLMQENLVVVNVWMEKKYKGYTYLSRGTRREMYKNAEKIAEDFKLEAAKTSIAVKELRAELDKLGLSLQQIDEVKLVYLAQIMSYLQPGNKYHYIQTSSFGKLLRDPKKQKLEGDCNQIVTLYAYLYSLSFPIDDLQIKLLPNHVCLHFKGIDIEATNGSFQRYSESKQVLPITEIISTNMLDLNDFREDSQRISERIFVKSAQLAYAISSLKEVVKKNLDVAYRNMAISTLNMRNFESALFFANKLGDGEFIEQIRRQKAVYRYNSLVKVVSGDKTVADLKRHKSVYREMLQLATELDDKKLQENIRKTLSLL